MFGVQSSKADVEDLCGAPLLLPAAESGAEGEAQVPALRLPLPVLRPHPAPGRQQLFFLSGSSFFGRIQIWDPGWVKNMIRDPDPG